MMNAKRSSNVNLTRYMFLVPAVVALLLVFSVSKAELHKAATSSKHLLTNIKTAVSKIDMPFKPVTHKPVPTASPIVSQQDTPKKNLNRIITNSIVYTPADSSKNYSILKKLRVKGLIASDSLRKYSNTLAGMHFKNNIVYNSVGQAEGITLKKNNIIVTTIPNRTFTLGNKIYMGNAIKDTTIGNTTTLKQLLSKIDTNQLQKVTKIKLNGKTMGKGQMDSLLRNMQGWKVDKDGNVTQNGVSVKGKFFAYSIDSSLHDMQGWKVDKDGTLTKDGRVMPRVVLGGKNATQGTITVPGMPGSEVVTMSRMMTGPIDFKNKLIVIDGKEATAKELKKLSADKIGTIQNFDKANPFLKMPDSLISKYGDKAKNGVVIIATKK